MSIETMTNTVFAFLVFIIIVAIFLILVMSVFQIKKKITESLDRLTTRFNNYTVQNEHEKLEIYKRLEDLEDK